VADLNAIGHKLDVLSFSVFAAFSEAVIVKGFLTGIVAIVTLADTVLHMGVVLMGHGFSPQFNDKKSLVMN
tara:strand:+ start:80 stop:292 length:213 start_codon:yes stop_codon:yes gene_type:complete